MPNSDVTNAAYTNPASGISYTNKDFRSIYGEELDLVKELTDRWDPNISNESDPGVVLLKENAIIADKENYNIDKNILETFPLSVSQYGNARQLYDALGYEMKWYRSATTEISYKYTGSSFQFEGTNQIKLPQFQMVTDSTGEYVYTLINPTPISAKDQTFTCNAIQGIITDFEIDGVKNITLNNLDADLRLYLPDMMVAENGIFISYINPTSPDDESNYNWEQWKRVQNLESYNAGEPVYAFGVLPNSNTCYIQFPRDIAEQIGNGLRIKYLITMGEAGNIPAGTIESFYGDVYDRPDDNNNSVINDDLYVTNSYSTSNGSDPEEIQDAYRNYKKTIGTFNTLVTCRDYENGIYNMVDGETEDPVASNAVVSDRTNDINYSHHVVTLTSSGEDSELVVDESGDTPKMSAFDLGLYVLAPMSSSVDATSYAKSFSVNPAYGDIKTGLEDLKSCQHNYIDTTSSLPSHSPFIIKNFYDLNGKLITFYKVTEEEVKAIQEKVVNVLYRNFNARKVEFGTPILYDDLLYVIKNADPRIKSVVLDDPVYVPYVMYGDDTEGTVNSSNVKPIDNTAENMCKNILTNLIANGNVQLYKFDENFQYSFGQDVSNQISQIKSIKTTASVAIPSTAPEDSNLRANEHLILSCPSYVAETTYTYFVKYTWNGDTISANTIYEIPAGKTLTIKWGSDEDSKISYGAGTILRSSVELNSSGTLGQTDTIEILKKNEVEFDNTGGKMVPPCYWILNNPENILFDSTHTSRVLDSGEYFIYTDTSHTDLVILGAGTKISTDMSVVSDIRVDRVTLNVDNIKQGRQDLSWYTGLTSLTIAEQDMIILSEGTKVYASTAFTVNSNTPSDLNYTLYYQSAGDGDYTAVESSILLPYQIRSRLDIYSPIGNPQHLLPGQSFEITYGVSNPPSTVTIPDPDDPDLDPEDLTTYPYVAFNTGLDLVGGEKVDLSVVTTAGTVTYPISLLASTENGSTYAVETSDDFFVVRGTDGTSDPLTFAITNVGDYNSAIIPFIIQGDGSKVTEISYSTDSGANWTDITGMPPVGLADYIDIASYDGNGIQLKVTFESDTTSTDVSVLIGKINPYDGYYLTDYLTSLGFNDPTTFMSDVKSAIDDLKNVNENAIYNKSLRNIEDLVEEPLSGDAFWDVDNPYNRFTIAQMRNCNISVIKSSRQ